MAVRATGNWVQRLLARLAFTTARRPAPAVAPVSWAGDERRSDALLRQLRQAGGL